MCSRFFFKKYPFIESIGNPAGIGKGTGFGLRDRDGIGLGHYRLRTTYSLDFQLHATDEVLKMIMVIVS